MQHADDPMRAEQRAASCAAPDRGQSVTIPALLILRLAILTGQANKLLSANLLYALCCKLPGKA